MTSIFANSALFLLIGSGSWVWIVLVVLLLLCCGMMPFGMRGMRKGSKRTDKTQEDSDEKHDDDLSKPT